MKKRVDRSQEFKMCHVIVLALVYYLMTSIIVSKFRILARWCIWTPTQSIDKGQHHGWLLRYMVFSEI